MSEPMAGPRADGPDPTPHLLSATPRGLCGFLSSEASPAGVEGP
ncbi:hypothetical protein ACFQVA_29490 [Actinomadura keratinilytica]